MSTHLLGSLPKQRGSRTKSESSSNSVKQERSLRADFELSCQKLVQGIGRDLRGEFDSLPKQSTILGGGAMFATTPKELRR